MGRGGRSLPALLTVTASIAFAACAARQPPPPAAPELVVPPLAAPSLDRPQPLAPEATAAAVLRASAPPSQRTGKATFDAKHFTIDRALNARLVSGVLITLELFDGAHSIATCQVHYDLWDELFDAPPARGRQRARTTEQAVRRCLDDKPNRPITVVER